MSKVRVIARPDMDRGLAASALPREARRSLLEEACGAVKRVICSYLDCGDVLRGLFHASRALRTFVCAPGEGALCHLDLAVAPWAELRRAVAPGGWAQLNTLKITAALYNRPPKSPAGVPRRTQLLESLYAAELGHVGGSLRALHLCEEQRRDFRYEEKWGREDGLEGDDKCYLSTVHIGVPPAVWPALEEFVGSVDVLEQHPHGDAIPWARGSATDAATTALRYNGVQVGAYQVGMCAPPPDALPALKRLELCGYSASKTRAEAYLRAAAATSTRLHTLKLALGGWSTVVQASLASLAPQLEHLTLQLESAPAVRVDVSAMPVLKTLHVATSRAATAELSAAVYPELVELAVDKGVDFRVHDGGCTTWREDHDYCHLPRLRVLTTPIVESQLSKLLKGAPALHTLRVILKYDVDFETVLATLCGVEYPQTHCRAHRLERVECVGKPWPAFDWEASSTALALVRQLLGQPALTHLTGIGLDLGSRVDWTGAGPALRSVVWCTAAPLARPAKLRPDVTWTNVHTLP